LAEGYEHSPERPAELEACWWAHRDQIMEEYGRPDSRPWGWCAFEAREPMPDHGDQATRLAELLSYSH
jgi:hypothetical protein